MKLSKRMICISFCLSVISCGDIVDSNIKIVGNYYLVDGETQNIFSICMLTKDGDYIEKVPKQVMDYGYSDSFIVAKVKNYNGLLFYYIINRKMDTDLGEEAIFRIGPISESEYDGKWRKRLNIKLRQPKGNNSFTGSDSNE